MESQKDDNRILNEITDYLNIIDNNLNISSNSKSEVFDNFKKIGALFHSIQWKNSDPECVRCKHGVKNPFFNNKINETGAQVNFEIFENLSALENLNKQNLINFSKLEIYRIKSSLLVLIEKIDFIQNYSIEKKHEIEVGFLQTICEYHNDYTFIGKVLDEIDEYKKFKSLNLQDQFQDKEVRYFFANHLITLGELLKNLSSRISNDNNLKLKQFIRFLRNIRDKLCKTDALQEPQIIYQIYVAFEESFSFIEDLFRTVRDNIHFQNMEYIFNYEELEKFIQTNDHIDYNKNITILQCAYIDLNVELTKKQTELDNNKKSQKKIIDEKINTFNEIFHTKELISISEILEYKINEFKKNINTNEILKLLENEIRNQLSNDKEINECMTIIRNIRELNLSSNLQFEVLNEQQKQKLKNGFKSIIKQIKDLKDKKISKSLKEFRNFISKIWPANINQKIGLNQSQLDLIEYLSEKLNLNQPNLFRTDDFSNYFTIYKFLFSDIKKSEILKTNIIAIYEAKNKDINKEFINKIDIIGKFKDSLEKNVQFIKLKKFQSLDSSNILGFLNKMYIEFEFYCNAYDKVDKKELSKKSGKRERIFNTSFVIIGALLKEFEDKLSKCKKDIYDNINKSLWLNDWKKIKKMRDKIIHDKNYELHHQHFSAIKNMLIAWKKDFLIILNLLNVNPIEEANLINKKDTRILMDIDDLMNEEEKRIKMIFYEMIKNNRILNSDEVVRIYKENMLGFENLKLVELKVQILWQLSLAYRQKNNFIMVRETLIKAIKIIENSKLNYFVLNDLICSFKFDLSIAYYQLDEKEKSSEELEYIINSYKDNPFFYGNYISACLQKVLIEASDCYKKDINFKKLELFYYKDFEIFSKLKPEYSLHPALLFLAHFYLEKFRITDAAKIISLISSSYKNIEHKLKDEVGLRIQYNVLSIKIYEIELYIYKYLLFENTEAIIDEINRLVQEFERLDNINLIPKQEITFVAKLLLKNYKNPNILIDIKENCNISEIEIIEKKFNRGIEVFAENLYTSIFKEDDNKYNQNIEILQLQALTLGVMLYTENMIQKALDSIDIKENFNISETEIIEKNFNRGIEVFAEKSIYDKEKEKYKEKKDDIKYIQYKHIEILKSQALTLGVMFYKKNMMQKAIDSICLMFLLSLMPEFLKTKENIDFFRATFKYPEDTNIIEERKKKFREKICLKNLLNFAKKRYSKDCSYTFKKANDTEIKEDKIKKIQKELIEEEKLYKDQNKELLDLLSNALG